MERAYGIMGAAEGAPAAALLEYLAVKQRAGRVRILGEPSWDPRWRVPTISLVHSKLSSAAVCAALAQETIGPRSLSPHPSPPPPPPFTAAADTAAAADNSAGDNDNARSHGIAETNRKGVRSSHKAHMRFSSSSSSSSNGFDYDCDPNNDDAEDSGRKDGRRPRIVCRHGSFLAPRLLAALGVPDPYGSDGVLRFSLVHYNTVSDVRNLIAALEDIGF